MFKFYQNPQFYQTLFLFIILNLGILFYGIYFDYTKLLITFLSVICFDMLFGRLRFGGWRFPFGGVNASFGISFFLRTDILLLYVFAAFLAVSSKYLFQVRGKHFFNPSNFGVFLTLCLFGWTTWSNPLQWGKIYTLYSIEFIVLIGILLLFGSMIVSIVYRQYKINLLYLILPFVCTHIAIYIFFTVENSWDSLIKFYTPAFLIFIFHMLTDPIILMKNNFSKALFGISVALGFYVLQYFINENYSLIASLFLMTIILPVIRICDDIKIYRNIFLGNVVAIFMVLLLGSIFWYKIETQGYPDLVFDNRCNALICH